MPAFVHPLDLEILLALAWSGPLLTAHLRLLVAPTMDPSGLLKHLRALKAAHLVDGHLYYQRRKGEAPKRRGWVWTITPEGFRLLPEDRRKPEAPPALRRALLDHDLLVGAFVACVVDQARPVLSGVQVVHEVRLDAERPRPRCDAIVVLKRSPHPGLPHVPWQSAPAVAEETVRGFAVEVDRETEGIGVIRDKAAGYKQVWGDPSFYRRYGRMPVPLWVVPNRRRLGTIMEAWRAVWPEGRWYMTTDDRLPALHFDGYARGEVRPVDLLDGWLR
ncbi:MAG: replication-relaxation family protein [Chloroflexota bacterium]|nr:replication-relaxation family protein [Chloroflexota bacterium]